jgi:hypothetical protein
MLTTFLRPGRVIALTTAALAVIALGLLFATGNRSYCDGPCPAEPVAADGSVVSDHFWFLHRDLGPTGSITVRLTSMTGTITYPPPDHDQIVSGLVPWAKAGIIVKDGTRRGSSYAALMMTGSHGVRLQHDYRHDIAGRPGSVSPQAPRWLRLTRSGDTVTGAESADGTQWHTVGTVRLPGLPDIAQVGLFAASPGDLTLRRVGLGGAIEEVRFTQATGVFDRITPGGAWRSEPIGEMNHTDWEKYHQASGAVEKDGVVTISGTGDIGPGDHPLHVEAILSGVAVALIIVLVVAARFGAKHPGSQVTPGALAVGSATFLAGLIGSGVALPAGAAILHGNGIPVQAISVLTGVRVIAGVAAALALCGVLAFGLGRLLRRGWAAVLVSLVLVGVPYVVTAVPLLPDALSEWLLRVTPAAGFAVKQTAIEYPQVVAHYSPSAGYFPLPAWAGFAVLLGYTLLVAWIAGRRPQPVGTPPAPHGATATVPGSGTPRATSPT